MDDISKRQHMTRTEAMRNAALSGGLSGSMLGGIGRALAGTRRPWDIAASAAIGGLGNAALTGGSVGLGSGILGEADYDDGSAYTKRAGVGGALGGAAAGGTLGGLAASGKLDWLKGGKLASELPLDNIIMDAAKKFIAKGVPWKRGAALGAGVGGLLGAIQASGEGMQVDAINNAIDEEQRKSLLEEELQKQMERLGYGA